MMVEVTYTEKTSATPESIWVFWKDVSSWSQWDHGIEWCKLQEGQSFQLNGEASLLPKGSPFAVNVRITECTPFKSFTDVGQSALGSMEFCHEIIPAQTGVEIRHTMRFYPISLDAKKTFETQMLPKIQKELPLSVKALARLAESKELTSVKG